MLIKLYVVLRVWVYMKKGHAISAIRLVRHTLIRGGTIRHYRLARDFVDDVNAGVWPTHY